MKPFSLKTVLSLLLVSISSASTALALQTDSDSAISKSDAEEVFVHRVQTIFKDKCLACHGTEADDLRGDFDMRTRKALLAGGESGDASIVPGKPDESPLVEAIKWDGLEMPPKENDRLTDQQIQYMEQWIAGGAPWPDEARQTEILKKTTAKWNAETGVQVKTRGGLSDDWTNRKYDPRDLWAYRPLWKDETGILTSSDQNPIDVLIEKRLADKDLSPVKRADAQTLLRRLTYDLTGLPPNSDEADQFKSQVDGQDLTKQIEQLLESPRYGEHWGQHWLDVVRYADSSGFSNDFLRANAWRYRDYVIRSFNNDKPYDQFLREQIAGDEINPDDPDSLIAVGYLRMGPWEQTAMSVAAVTRQHFLDDITNNVGVTFLANELRCASCHDHKFDPIPTQDYYRMQAVFAPTQFVDRKVAFQDYENVAGNDAVRRQVLKRRQNSGPKSLSTIPQSEWPVKEWDLDSEKKGHVKVGRKRAQILAREQKRYKPFALSVYSGPAKTFVSTALFTYMPEPDELDGEAEIVKILSGGSIESPTVPVSAGVLSAVTSVEAGAAIPETIQGRRAALANWLSSPDHPLTARVIVNRVWLYHFGKGLAGNPNNFGVTGKKPTHPELLDFLAGYLIENDWSIKKLHRLILTSDTWQRASGPVSDQVKQIDPDNLLYSYFTPRRLSAEELRDSMLAVSGELNKEMGGIPIRPEINLEVAMQPRQIMGSVAPAYQPSIKPSQRNRRTIYAERIRSLRDPMLEVFNRPGSDTSCEARDSSTITPQAFTLLNSQSSQDRSIAWADRLTESHENLEPRLRAAFQEAFGRLPSDEEARTCQQHFARSLKYHQSVKPEPIKPPTYVIRHMVEEMTGLPCYWVEDLEDMDDYEPDLKSWDVSAETRALADLCLVLFNSNEFVYIY